VSPELPIGSGTTAGQKSSHSVPFLLSSILLAAALLYFSLRKVDWRQVWESISHCNLAWLALGVALSFLSYFLRGLRWRVLLNTQAHLPVLPVFWANSAGYLGNNVLPARAGELIRTAMVSSRSHLSKTFVLTTALAERLMDAIVLVISGSIVLRYVPSPPQWIGAVSSSLLSLGSVAAVILISIPFLEPFAIRLLDGLPFSPRAVKRIEAAVEHVASGVRSFHDPSTFLLFLVYTMAIWGLDSFGVTILARSLHMQMSMSVGLLLLVGLGVGSALPSTPGYIGIFQFVAVTVLTPFHFTRSEAIAFILVAQAGGLLVTGVLGAIGLLQYRRMRESIATGAVQA
jgi:glycosyltransferase 2 family protein